MDNSPVKNPFDDITSDEVYEEAILQGSIQRIHADFLSCIRNSSSYKFLMEAAEQNILGDQVGTLPLNDVQSKKERLKEIAYLASQFESTVSEFFTATKDVEGKPVIEKIIKELSYLKTESASKLVSPSTKGKTLENNNSEETNVRSSDEKKPGTSKNICNAEEDSYDSVSSVLTSELSALSDEIEIPTENRGSNGKKPKIISFKSVNKAYKSMVEEKKKTPIKRRRVKSTSKACVSSISKDSGESDALPKRQRKPNSRYISK